LAPLQDLPQEQFAAQPQVAAAGFWQPQVQALPWHAAQLQATGCFVSVMVRFLRWFDDGMSSMTVTVVDRA